MKLYYAPRTRATRPRWLLEELGVPYELVRLDRAAGALRTPEHLARHPMGRVPVLEDGDARLFESAAICLWLAERFPEKGMLPPAGTPGRALTYQWLFFAMDELEPPVEALHGLLRPPEGERDAAAIEAQKARFLEGARVLDLALRDRPFLAGDAFGVADLVTGAVASWGKALVGGIDGMPALAAWLAGVKARPAWKRAIAD
ncbi:glutathione S-transferase domain protein [Anaeromyxobacter sp. K]|uniref:glutathione S-transferase family protein n=1 Tax=Anaeromyxobacter sp. (strain K) TaxID=447217 RepID=UPI00015F9C6E|nr:glutathione S-transferase family protein [Anaeromyxobacter sp. K]ACG74676.1 glutathione S-transferase domain protein [Anaeromyxobacter sp. K]